MSTKIYHNPRCSKSRQTLQLLRDNNVEPEIIEYLKTPPSADELQAILKSLDMKPRDLMRKKEAEYKENNLSDPALSDEQLIAAMIAHPKLIERPIVVTTDTKTADNKYALGRPPESILEIIT
ncbi:MAG: arsenate reductase (glutaredoxin) [Gammaproteobacteria bacterium]|nr:arsenate reductase (glutaredoxin) [Gammaproteobacteria bacterium]